MKDSVWRGMAGLGMVGHGKARFGMGEVNSLPNFL